MSAPVIGNIGSTGAVERMQKRNGSTNTAASAGTSWALPAQDDDMTSPTRRMGRGPQRMSNPNETPLPPPEPNGDEIGPLVGQTFGGYEIVSFIGEGPSGAVYRGEDLLGNAMAVKVIHSDLASHER